MPTLTRDWSIVRKIAPELGLTVKRIEEFLLKIPTMNHVEPRRLIQIYKLDPVELHLALEIARDRRLVKRSFGMLSLSSKCHAQGYWDKVSSIPKVLYDTGDDRFRRSDGELIVVYRHPSETDPDE